MSEVLILSAGMCSWLDGNGWADGAKVCQDDEHTVPLDRQKIERLAVLVRDLDSRHEEPDPFAQSIDPIRRYALDRNSVLAENDASYARYPFKVIRILDQRNRRVRLNHWAGSFETNTRRYRWTLESLAASVGH